MRGDNTSEGEIPGLEIFGISPKLSAGSGEQDQENRVNIQERTEAEENNSLRFFLGTTKLLK